MTRPVTPGRRPRACPRLRRSKPGRAARSSPSSRKLLSDRLHLRGRDQLARRTYSALANVVDDRDCSNGTGLARTPADVERIAKSGKRIIMIGMENGYPMGTDLGNLRRFYDLGARYLTLTHRDHNQLADSSSAPEPRHGGLLPLGRRVVAELNRLGMMVDVSHISARSFWDVIAITTAPIVASHSACAALNDSDRNLTDEQLGALARNGSVIQIAGR